MQLCIKNNKRMDNHYSFDPLFLIPTYRTLPLTEFFFVIQVLLAINSRKPSMIIAKKMHCCYKFFKKFAFVCYQSQQYPTRLFVKMYSLVVLVLKSGGLWELIKDIERRIQWRKQVAWITVCPPLPAFLWSVQDQGAIGYTLRYTSSTQAF